MADLAQPFTGLEQFIDDVLGGVVYWQLVDDNIMELLIAECATQLKTINQSINFISDNEIRKTIIKEMIKNYTPKELK